MKIEMLDPSIAYTTHPFRGLMLGQFFTAVNPVKFDYDTVIGMKLEDNQFWNLTSGTIAIFGSPDAKVYLLQVVSVSLKPVFITPP
jgi:hypothetical protein